MDRNRKYYSERKGRDPKVAGIDFEGLLRFSKKLLLYFEKEGYFQKSLGFTCVDQGFIPGEFGHDLEGAVFLKLGKSGLTPIQSKIEAYSDEDLFDMLELLYDHCAKPIGGYFHDWNDCGWHRDAFDLNAGRKEFREKFNELLSIYGDGFELSNDGEVLEFAPTGLEGLFEAELPDHDPDNVEKRIEAARSKFRRHHASLDDRREALRELADVFEFLRPKLKAVLSKDDESDLFNIANNFGIRHHNQRQKTDYDKPIWYSWVFYFYLATLHASLRLISKREKSE
ncbi:MAG: hypothetical protein H6616_18280 [Ignavibacteria bacterium]|nr:hypothetical protein [Ignavibacteria bacterium]